MLKRARYGPLHALETGDGDRTIVLFHGYGANGADLAPLAQEVPARAGWRWVFPDAPLETEYGGRMWFPIDLEDVERAQRSGRAVDWSQRGARELAEARETAALFLAELDVPRGRLVLGGFSQGAMLALDLALRGKAPPLGVLLLSGNLINAKEWRELAPARRGLPFFQSHGIADPILGFSGARALEAALLEAGWTGKLLSFEGGHYIPPEALAALGRFLDSLPT